jgi:hypothetical protein
MFKKVRIIMLVLLTVVALSVTAFAAPPVGDLNEDYYCGIWKMKTKFQCFRQADGLPVNFADTSYAAMRWNHDLQDADGSVVGGYEIDLHVDKDDAQVGDNIVGGSDMLFDFGSTDTTCISQGYGFCEINKNNFKGLCELQLYGFLSTDIEASENPRKSRLRGLHKTICYPTGGTPLLCYGSFFGQWVEEFDPISQ